MAKNITTRISLRNDVLSAWQNSSIKLNQGEVALARLSGELSDRYEMRIGVGDKTWNELSNGGIQIPAENVTGLTEAIAQLSTSYYETDDINKLSDTASYVNGDIAVQKVDIDLSGHQEYTAYRWNGATSAWNALDGNYSAENVFFPNDMTMTYAFGKYSVPTSGSYTLSCAGKSVAAVLNDAYAEVKSSAKTDPTFTYTIGSYTAKKEVGNTYTIPAATLKMTSAGAYTEYTPQPATGITVPVGQASVKSPEFDTKTNTSAMAANSTLATSAGSTSHTYGDDAATYTYTASVSYTQGAIPKNNLGGDDPDNRIPAGTWSSGNQTATFTGQRYYFWGYKTDGNELDIDNLTSGQIRQLGNSAASMLSAANAQANANFSVPSGTKQIIFAAPTGTLTKKIAVYNKSSLNAKVDFANANARVVNKVQVEGANNYTAKGYDIWYVTFGATLNASDLVVTWES